MNDDLLQAVVDTAIDGLILIEADGRIALFNTACERLFGYAPAEVLGQNVSMLMPEPDRSAHDGYIARYRGTGEKRIIGVGRDVLGRRKDGTVFPFELAVGEYNSPDGRQMFVGVIHDLSKYRRSEERFRKVVDTAIDGMILIDGSGHIKLYNPACEALFGYAPEEVLGQNISMLMPEPDRSGHDGYLRHHLQTGEQRIIGVGRDVLGRRKNGTVFPFALAVGSFEEDGASMFVGVIHDLTKYRRSQDRRRESEARFRLLVDSITDYAIFLMDANGVVLTWNTGAQNLTGYTPEEAIGKTRDVYYVEAERSTSPADALRIAEEKNRYVNEEWRMRKDGTRFWASVVISALRDQSGALTGFVNITRDMTERQQADELRDQLRHAQKMEALGQLTGGVAHDFNNLLAVIVGNLELLGDRVKDNEGKRLIEQAMRNALNGAELTRRLLAFGRQQKLKPIQVDVNELIDGMIDMLRRTLGNGIDIRSSLALDVYMVEVDAGQLENALLNIAINARDAMDGAGALQIRSAITYLDEPRAMPTRTAPIGTYVMIAIRDTGKGMPPDVIARIFEPFFTTKEIGKGSGLGLSMVYGFVVQSGGYVEVESQPGQGTEFRIYLPALESERLASRRPENEPGRRLVLCVDDNPDVRATVTALLGSLGFAVLPASTGETALAELRRGLPIDLVLTDIQMPGAMDGFELARRMRSTKPDMPVLFMSGSTGTDGLRDTPFAGLSRILAKPVRKADLAEAIEALLPSKKT